MILFIIAMGLTLLMTYSILLLFSRLWFLFLIFFFSILIQLGKQEINIACVMLFSFSFMTDINERFPFFIFLFSFCLFYDHKSNKYLWFGAHERNN